ncbi:MAG: hydrolase [Isosphaeraceae bacterium]|nr:MAG: hydrolase [Isosphaeraceae bacterium]
MSVTTRLTARDGTLLLIDIQERLLPHIDGHAELVQNACLLLDAAQALELPVLATEQYPRGLGPTVAPIAQRVPHRAEKSSFSCCGVPELLEQLHGRSVRHVTLAGIEAHVCVAQTALDLLAQGFVVQVAADAVGSRHPIDWQFALRRLERAGAVVSTCEAILFEWTESSDHPAFKTISRLVKQRTATTGSPPSSPLPPSPPR